MAQKKKGQPAQKKQSQRKMSTSQKIMAVIGILIVIAMVLSGVLPFFQ